MQTGLLIYIFRQAVRITEKQERNERARERQTHTHRLRYTQTDYINKKVALPIDRQTDAETGKHTDSIRQRQRDRRIET